jgi:hypothetical protein
MFARRGTLKYRTLLTLLCSMAIQDVQVLIAQARLEAGDPQFKVRFHALYKLSVTQPLTGLFSSLCLYW